MKTFKLKWVDDVEATYPGITTDGREHTYTFEVESLEDAQAFIRSFAMLNSEHDMRRHELTEIEEGEIA